MTPALGVLTAIVVASLSGVPGFFARRAGERIAAVLLWLAAALTFLSVAQVFWSGAPSLLSWRWAVPGGGFALRLDALAAFFLVPTFLVGALGATYALEYWPEVEHPDNARRLRFVYGLIIGGLALVMVAANAWLFLAGWEVMALAAFIAVGTEDHLAAAREASQLYLALTRAGTLLLFVMFALLHSVTGSFALDPITSIEPGKATAIFVLALLGFGMKAGLMPLHLWLPGAHAAAPSHVSALMSGVLIKIGVYGLVRLLSLLPAPPLWWGEVLLAVGVTSGVLGVVFALAQHDLKRLLAYHSIENLGIIVMGVAVAVIGRSVGDARLVVLGLAGGLLHVWNHGLFKSLLFLSGGAVVHACGTREIDQLGGLLPKMPRVAAFFLLGAVAICGLPPLNGFVSELFIYLGLFAADATLGAVLAAPALALIGGLALACFAKLFGAAFLGHARSDAARHAHEPGPRMLVPMAVLGAGCLLLGLAPGAVAPVLDACARAFAPDLTAPLGEHAPLSWLSLMAIGLLLSVGLVALLGRARLRRGPLEAAETWGCGYAAPTSRMQYSSSSFAALLVDLFSWALRPEVHRGAVTSPFPRRARFASHVADTVLDGVVLPVVGWVATTFGRLRWLQAGSINLYLAYVGGALVFALAWLKGVFP